MKLSRELKIAAIGIVTIVLFIWSYNFMKGKNILDGKTPIYYTKFSSTEGLNTASKVLLKGVPVGKVESTELIAEEGELLVVVAFSMLEKEIPFSKNAIIKLQSDGLMGGKSLAIIPSKGEPAVPGDYLQGKIESDMFSAVGESLGPLQGKFENLLLSSDSLLVGLNDIMDSNTKNNIKQSIAMFNQTMSDFKAITANLNTMLETNKLVLEATLSSAKEATDNVTSLTGKLNTELEQANIAKTVQELKATIGGINAILTNLEKGEGSMGKLLKDEAMYTNLTNASKELEELLREMKEHPKRFVHFSVFGKKDKTGYVTEDEK